METRISRYAKLRKEIEQMSSNDLVEKEQSNGLPSENLINSSQKNAKDDSLETVLKNVRNKENESNKEKEHKLTTSQKRIIIYSSIASFVVLVLVITIIIVGIIVF